MSSAHDPLSAEERELAGRLARLSAADGPPSALDARILAAAAEATGARSPGRAAPSAHRRPRATRRWPVAAGAVATLALAVGLAWQLRPTPQSENDAFYSVADDTAARGAGPAAASAEPEPVPDMPAAASVADAAAPEAAEARKVAAPTPGAEDAAAAAPQRSSGAVAPTDDGETSRARIQSAPFAEDPPIVFDAPAPAPTEAQPPAAPAPPPPPPPQAAPVVQGSRAPPRAAPERARQDAAGNASEAKAGGGARREADALEVGGSRVREQAEEDAPEQAAYDASINDEPPATADSPDVQRAWLQRIRELAANGDVPGAKASLAEFRRRYPQHPVPDDLRSLSP